VDLAHEYFKLGKSKEASATHNHILGIIREGNHGDDVRVKFFLRYAESLAVSDSIRER
jgi:separase